MNDDLFNRGFHNVDTAHFVRSQFIPLAQAHRRWNVVVYEAHRATELLVRGMIYILGRTPPDHHNLSAHLSVLARELENASSRLPFYVGVYNESGDGLGVRISPGRLTLNSRTGGTFTMLGATAFSEPMADVTSLTLDTSSVRSVVYLDDTIFVMTPSGIPEGELLRVTQTFHLESADERVARLRGLRKLGKALFERRAPAYYSEQSFGETDADSAVRTMNEAVSALAGIFHTEPLRSPPV